MTTEFGLLLPTREAVMSRRPETGPHPHLGGARGGRGLRLRVDRRFDHGQAASRAAHLAGRGGRVHEAGALGHGRAPARAATARRSSPRSWPPSTASRRAGSSSASASRATRRPSARSSKNVGVPFGAPGRPLPGNPRDLPGPVAPRRRELSREHFALEDVTMDPKPHRAGGPPIWIGGSGPIALREAARFDAWFPTGPERGVLRRAVPPHPGGGPRGRPRRRRGDRRGLCHPRPRSESRRGGEAASRISRALLQRARGGDHEAAGDLRRARRGLRRVAPALDHVGRPSHLAALRGRGSHFAQVDEVASRILPRLR